MRKKIGKHLNTESYKVKSQAEGLDMVANDKHFGFLVEGGKARGIFSKR